MKSMMTATIVRRALAWLGRNLTVERMVGAARFACRLAAERPPAGQTAAPGGPTAGPIAGTTEGECRPCQ
jgi:hypothetical protein